MQSGKFKIKSFLVISALVIGTWVLVGMFGAKSTRALEISDFPPVIQRLIDRFGLNKDEVTTVMDEVRQERQQQRQQLREERLDKAVSDGVITEEQKQALLNKWQEMETEREQHREEMRQWMESSGIDFESLAEYGVGCGFGGPGFGRGLGHGWRRGGF